MVKEAKTTWVHSIWEAKAACSTAIRDVEAWRASQAKLLQREHGKTSCRTWRCKPSRRRAEVKSTSSLPTRLLYMLAQQSSRVLWWPPTTSYWGRHLCLTHLSYHKGLLQWRNSPLWQVPLHQFPSSLLGPKDDTLPQIPWRACLWAEAHQRWLQKNPQFQVTRDPTLEQSTQAKQHKGIGQDSNLVKEAREEFFLKHPYNFVTEGTCDLLGIFRQMTTSANLLDTSIYEIQASWTGPDELKQANYAVSSLPKGLKFLHVVPPYESPKVIVLMGIHDPDALCCFSSISHCPWCGKKARTEGTVVNHLWMVHYRLGLVCNKCHDCPSIMSDTLHHHGWQDCWQPREKNPNESVSSE